MKPLLLCALALLTLLTACSTVPISGRSQFRMMSEQEEVKMGLNAYREILSKEKISKDPKLNAMINRVGKRIAAVTGAKYQWEFTVVDNDKMVNAFCLPGGKVAVYTGILPITKDEDGLAAVIGHEVAHAIARHSGERASQRQATSLARTVIGVVGGSGYAQLFGLGANLGLLLPYSRVHESEADHLGLIYMAKAGYNPRAAVELWRRMAAHKKGKTQPEFLSTHPSDQTRISKLQKLMPSALKHYRPR